ncbi:hydrolase [Streptomyces spiroverticillatus]|uniref:Hydrolase n=1 Tax=Streptomyces finlayi TaxID=67296 RepID=A0A918XA05_9ACTN|nr:serine hydrolase domain-containing protein [Streptomyces finlayi]GHA47319.1 hydrolase [Streptomyces spiroverticillatus]GHD18573.1 hydrolase [Streptomyces finlayi]
MQNPLDSAALTEALEKVQRAGVPGLFAEIRHGDEVWRGAVGVADLTTGRPVAADMKHRIGSLTKTFTTAAVLQQAERGTIGLDTPIGTYLPHLVPGLRGEQITVRMLINHTSGLAEYLPYVYTSLKAFPDLARTGPECFDEHRHTHFDPTELIRLGVGAPAFGPPGVTPGLYSNTNYLLLAALLEHATGTTAEECITENVIKRAGLHDTAFPTGPHIEGPHSRLYECWFGMIDPPRDYSVFDMSYAGPSANLISTVADLNRFYAALLSGEIVTPASLAAMQQTTQVISQELKTISYGLGLYPTEAPGRETFWGHGGSVWGGGTLAMTRADGRRQLALAMNLQRWNTLDPSGRPQPHPIDKALADFYDLALYG